MDDVNKNNAMWIIIAYIVIMSVSAVIANNLFYKHSVVDSEYSEALHVKLPGYIELYRQEREIDLKKWVGSGIIGIKAEVNGVENAEVQASYALRYIGLADSTYILKQKDGHWVLYSPPYKWKEWIWWGAHYRIGTWKKDK